MAENKKSFLLYCDLIHTVRKMPKDKVADLFLHILSYVNDENPVTDDMIIDLTFEPIKQQLKRDLKRYESIVERNRNNGKNGGRPKKEPKKPNGLSGNPKKPDEPKKADNDIDNGNDKDILLEKETKHIYTFTDFWQAYPKKVEKQKCEKIFSKLKADEILKIKETLPNFISYKPFEYYTHPNPQTYLNGKRWEDEITVVSKPAYTGTNQLQPKYND